MIIGIVPGIIVENGIVSSYEDRAVSIRSITVKNQCDILCNQIIKEGYLDDPSSETLNGEFTMLSNLYSGRILVIDRNFRVIRDTYDLDTGKYMISSEVLNCFNGEEISNYDDGNRYIEMTVKIQAPNSDDVLGVMLVSISTDEIVASMDVLEKKGTLLVVIIALLVLVLGYVLSGLLVRPFARVTKAIEDLTDGYLEENISVPDYTETELITDVMAIFSPISLFISVDFPTLGLPTRDTNPL